MPWNADWLKMKSASSALCKCHSHLNHSVGVQKFHILSDEKSHRIRVVPIPWHLPAPGKIACDNSVFHYNDVIMTAMASQITSLTIVYPSVYSSADQRKHQSSASLAFVRGIHRWPVNSLHKGPVTRKLFPFDDVIMLVLMIQHDGLPVYNIMCSMQHSEIFIIISLI